MKRLNCCNPIWILFMIFSIIVIISVVSSQFGLLKAATQELSQMKQSSDDTLIDEDSNGFPFEIQGNRFVRKSDNKPVFLNIIGYQPLEPGQVLDSEIHEKRIRDDIRRLRAYQGGTEPIVLRVYPGPTDEETNRIPKIFYDSVRELGFWIIRDIYFEPNCADPNAEGEGHQIINAVLSEVNDANAFDVIFAWEIGDELEAPYDGNETEIKEFIENMCRYLKGKLPDFNSEGDSNLVTWASWAANDPLHTAGNPIEPNCLDYISYNVYSYDPIRMRDHQSGPVTGTPFQGYLAALKKRYPDKPLVISETGLADNNSSENIGDHPRLHSWYPVYRKGGLTSEQVAEALADRYWDSRLLRDEEDPNIVIAGLAIFEWNDEWWKYKDGNSANQEDKPEEYFGLGRFKERTDGNMYQLRYKLQQETIHDLYTLKFRNDPAMLDDIIENTRISRAGESTIINAAISEKAGSSVRYRWEANRGYIVGDGSSVEYYPANNILGPVRITTVSIDSDHYAAVSSSKINIQPSEPNSIEILTFGVGVDLNDPNVRASGRVTNVNLDEYKLVCYIYNWHMYVQPYLDANSIWIDSEGYWWTKITNSRDNPGKLYCWLVPKLWPPEDNVGDPNWIWRPPDFIYEANSVSMDSNDYNDIDNDLLPDYWEENFFHNPADINDRYDDPDNDGANNLEEFLAGTSPIDANDNDAYKDGLPDNWERLFFGEINRYDANDNPDGDDSNNLIEWQLGTHPGRTSVDRDNDGLPDLWEIRWFGNLDANDQNNPDGDCFNNLDEYQLGLDPTSRMSDLDLNCNVDFVDYALFADHWREGDCNDPNWCGGADLDKSSYVDLSDLSLLTENWVRYMY
jgi:hypothetical protein